MTPLRGRDKHIYIGAEDGEGQCIRCRHPKTEHAPHAFAAGPLTYAGVTRRERERLAEELAPNGRAWGR